MIAEFIFPYNNEEEFARIAKELGIKKIIFLYDEKDYDPADKKLDFKTDVEIEKGIFLSKVNSSVKSKYIAVRSSDKDREIMETRKANIIFGLEESGRKDFMHQRASGLNHISCEIARKNNITIGFSYSSLLKEHSSVIAGRMMQNFRLCRKFKVNTLIASFTDDPYELRNRHDVNSLFKVLGF